MYGEHSDEENRKQVDSYMTNAVTSSLQSLNLLLTLFQWLLVVKANIT